MHRPRVGGRGISDRRRASTRDRVLEQRRLADARLTYEREHATTAVARLRQEPVDGQPLRLAAQEHGSILATRLP